MSPRRKAPPRPDPAEQERKYLAYVLQAFQFLATDFAYVDIGSIPLQTRGFECRGYVNPAARLQIEVSGVTGSGFTGLIRRLVDGVPAPYGDTTQRLTFNEIAMVRQPSLELSHNILGWEGAVDASAQLLRSNPDLLTGEGWISPSKIRRAWDRHFSRRFGLKAVVPADSMLGDFRSAFAFLLEFGYEITIDTDLLSPHEYWVTPQLRYQKGAHRVDIRCLDVRDAEWIIERDDRQVGDSFAAMPAEVAARAAMIRKDLSDGA